MKSMLKTDKEMLESLLKKANISVIEGLLLKEGEKLEGLRLKSLDYGKYVSPERLRDLATEVKFYVDDFLGSHGISFPILYQEGETFGPEATFPFKPGSIVYEFFGNQCYMDKNTIILVKERMSSVPGSIAHEYAHHVQGIMLGKDFVKANDCFIEGHSRGVERYIADVFSSKESDETFMYDITDSNFFELKGVYIYLCEKYGLKQHPLVSKIMGSNEDMEWDYQQKNGKPSPYAIGNTFLYMKELLHGKGIYGEALGKAKPL